MQITKWELIFVLAITLIALVLYSFDLNSYKYSYVGDEWGFYAMARDIAEGKRGSLTNLFSENGVYGDTPMVDSFYQAAIMKLVGINNFGFRFSSVLAAAASLLPFYIFLRLAISMRTAMAGTFCLCFSHYFIAWAHNGHNNNHIVFPLVLSLCLFILAYERRSCVLFALCGLSTGLSFYTYYTARLTLILVFILFMQRRPARRYFLAFVLVFAIVVAPLLLSGPAELLDDIRGRWFDHPDWKTDNQAKKMVSHIGLSLICPITFDGWGHGYFVAGSLFDPITTLLFIAGVTYSISRISRRSIYAFLLLGYVISAVAVGATTPYPRLSVTRQLILVPIVCMLAGLGADRLSALANRSLKSRKSIYLIVVLIAGGSIVWLNLHRLYIEMPEINGLHPLCLATKYVQENEENMRYYYILPEDISFWARLQLEAYGLSGRVWVYQPEEIIDDPSSISPPCDVIVSAMKPEKIHEIMRLIKKRFSTSEVEVVEGPRGGPWRIWGISDIHIISVKKARLPGNHRLK